MKKKSLKYLVLGCIAAALAGAMTACGESHTPNSSSSDIGSSSIQTGTGTGSGSSDTGSSSSQTGSPTQFLSAPTGLYLEIWQYYNKTDYALTWEEVEHAERYQVTIGEKTFETETTSCVITEGVTVGENCDMELVAIGDGYVYGNSVSVSYESEIEAVTEELRYESLWIGEYAVNKRYASDEVQGRVVMPDRFEDGYIKKIADGAFKKSSYEFDPSKKALDFRWSRYLTEIGKEAFEYNAQVKRMRIPEGVTSIQAEAFKYCQELEEIALPSSLEELGESAFQGCRFQEVEISNNVQEIPKNLFLACNFLTDVTLPEGVKTIGHSAFKNCILLTEIHIPSSVSVIENSAFKGCVELETVNFPSGLESIEGNAFSNCKNLKQVELTANIKTVGRFAFEGCDSLSVRISAGFTGDLEKVFCGIEKPSSFKEILVDENNSLYRAEDSRKLFSKDGKLLAWSLLETETEIVIPDGTVEIGAGVFSYGTQITAVSFSVGLKVIGENAFRECSIEQIVFPQGLQRIGSGAFSHTKLKKVVLPSSMEVCDSSFSGCPMEEIVYQEGVTSIFLQTYNSVYLSNGTVLPKSLKEIKGVNVQSKINKIYFLGTAEEWAQVTFSGTTTGSYQSENPPVYFYSEKEPEEEGNFWHYDQNGSPVVWD